MGFGSYDESEQERQHVETEFNDEEAEINRRERDHHGSMEFDSGATNDELLARLEEIKEE